MDSMSIIDMLLKVAVAATHRPGVPRPRTIAVSKDGIRRELRLHEVVEIAAKIVNVAAPPTRNMAAVCRLLRDASTAIRKIRQAQRRQLESVPESEELELSVLDLRYSTCELSGLAYQHWQNLRNPKLGTKTLQTGAALTAVFGGVAFDAILVDTKKDASAIGFYLARRGLTALPVVAKHHQELASRVKGLPEGNWSEPTVMHG